MIKHTNGCDWQQLVIVTELDCVLLAELGYLC